MRGSRSPISNSPSRTSATSNGSWMGFSRCQRNSGRVKRRSLAIPLIEVDNIPFSEMRVQAPINSPVLVQLPTGTWRRLTMPDGIAGWSTSSRQESIACEFHYPEVPRSQAFAIRRAFLRAVIDAGGAARCRAQYRIVTAPDTVVITLPVDHQLDTVWWNRQRVELPPVRRTARGTTIQIPLGASQRGRAADD